MKAGWKKRVKIGLNNVGLETLIKDLLSGPMEWNYNSIFQRVVIDLRDVTNMAEVRKEIFEWLEKRV